MYEAIHISELSFNLDSFHLCIISNSDVQEKQIQKNHVLQKQWEPSGININYRFNPFKRETKLFDQ